MGIAGSIHEDLAALEEYGTEPFDGDDDYSAGNALEGSGHPADPTPTYNGRPRTAYSYSGDSRAAFNQWRDGEITTQEFARRTPAGDGTAALSLGAGGVPAVFDDTRMLALAALAAVAVAYGVSR